METEEDHEEGLFYRYFVNNGDSNDHDNWDDPPYDNSVDNYDSDTVDDNYDDDNTKTTILL